MDFQPEVWVRIFKYLDRVDLNYCLLVNQKFNYIIETNQISLKV